MNHFTPPPPPPPRLIARLTAALLALALPIAALAQLPQVSIATGTGGQSTGQTLEWLNNGCLDSAFLWFKADRSANNVMLNLRAVTVSGPERLRDYGVPAYKAAGSAEISTGGTFRANLTTSYRNGRALGMPDGMICWGDDKIESDGSVVRIMLMRGAGYTIDPNKPWVEYSVFDQDTCSEPGGRTENEGVVYRFNSSGGAWGTCTCTAESRSPEVRRALDRTIPTPGPDGRFGTDDDGTTDAPAPSAGFLSRLAAQFHDPSYLYCDESPYKGLPGG